MTDYLLFINRLKPFCTFHLHWYTLCQDKRTEYLQIKINNSIVLANIQITEDNRKLLKPFFARVEESL